MKRQIILNLLNLPGIVGLGLMDGHSRPYFSGIDRALNFQQKEALAQGIQQVISTAPPGFESFDFRFAQREAWIYKLKDGVILLVVTDSQLDTLVYNDTVAQLKNALESDPHSAVSTFRLLAGSTTLGRNTEGNTSGFPEDGGTTLVASANSARPPSAKRAADPTTWNDYLAALNALTDATAPYLGKIVVANTWRATRPQTDSLNLIQLDRDGHFSLNPEGSVSANAPIETTTYTAMHEWVAKFVQRCSTIIRDYVAMVIQEQLSDHQKAILQVDRLAS